MNRKPSGKLFNIMFHLAQKYDLAQEKEDHGLWVIHQHICRDFPQDMMKQVATRFLNKKRGYDI